MEPKEANREFRENLQRIIDAIPAGIHVVDVEGRIVEVNRAWLIHFGKNHEDVKGKLLKDVMRSMIYFDSGTSRRDDPWEFTDPAALEVLKTALPATATFHQGQSAAVARPIFNREGKLTCVVTTCLELQTPGSRERFAAMNTVQREIMLGISAPMDRVRQMIQRVAKTDATVLICGETGTGKEVAADEIHRQSNRADRPFVKVNCSAIPESLWESELFGYEKGSFTGALKNGKAGLMESAHRGTLLLDEIGEMPLSMQPKLLRAIQERSLLRVGGVNPIPVDLRIIATTNRDLAREVEEGRFREDLYYRLNVIPIQMPPLRQRGEDVRLIARHYLEQFQQKYSRTLTLTEEAWRALEEYTWPGNVRQLRNYMERLVVLSPEETVSGSDLQESLGLAVETDHSRGRVVNLQEATEELHAKLIRSALREYHTTYRAAEALGISQPTLVRKAKALGIPSTGEERGAKEGEITAL